MKRICLAIVATSLLIGAVNVVFADNADDKKWIRVCVMDNVKDKKAQVQTGKVILGYCTCMNDKMSENETQPISEWEKTHKAENEACSKEAGWVGE